MLDIRQNLREALPNLPKKLALAARYALDYPDRIALDSMRTTAKEIGVTSPTMVRLAKQLGFDGYEEFKAGFQSELVATGFGSRADLLRNAEQASVGDPLPSKIMKVAETSIQNTFSQLDMQSLSAAAEKMRNAPACYLVGSGSLYWLASVLKTTGSMALGNLRLVGIEISSPEEALGGITDKDVVICFGSNPCALRTIRAKEHAKRVGATVISFTDRPSSPLAVDADHAFCAETHSPHYYPSMVSLMAVVETLLATVVATGDGSELKRIETHEKLRKESAAYLEY